MNKLLILVSIAIGLGTAGFMMIRDDQPETQVASETAKIDIEQGRVLYAENCASCHGVNLEGQPNWQSKGDDGRLPAPPHNERGHTWHHGDGLLLSYTKLGGKETLAERGMDFDSGMPGFGDTLSDAEIWGILNYVKSTWSERMLQTQSQRTQNEQMSGN
jgi:mono/diheme cytochrome c family protein